MNPLIESKLNALKNANSYECWYLVKQDTSFSSLCYLVTILRKYQLVEVQESLERFIKREVAILHQSKPDIKVSPTHRALLVASYFGLMRKTSSNYKEAIITDVYHEVTARCNGEYEKIELYDDIIQRQIEKMFISSSIDEGFTGVRKGFRLYPIMLLYKILLELGKATGEYSISMTEYRYLVATTQKYEEFLDTLLLIISLRKEPVTTSEKFEQFRNKFDSRLIQALKQLDTLIIDKDKLTLNPEKIDEVARKLFVFERNSKKLDEIGYINFLCSTKSLFEDNENNSSDSNTALAEIASNILLYGVPGCGKSHTIKAEYCDDEAHMERAVFHPDYTYSDFVGQILPKVEDGHVKYEFTPGPFTRIMKKAHDMPTEMFYLVIEEINRGNAPAIFGDIFQLLDRDENGTSEYGVSNANIAEEVYGDKEIKVKIPANLYVLATMNTSDQNVFTLDTAFKRRWSLKRIENIIDGSKYADMEICSFGVTWGTFAKTINSKIVELSENNFGNEDNRLGAYFIHPTDLDAAERFGEKVLMYLWNDAFKLDRERVFKSEYRTLDELLDGFYKVGLEVFCNDIVFAEISTSNIHETLTDVKYISNAESKKSSQD